ncbi:MAG: YcnI family protein [Pseudonocardiaceae bacterium]
MSKISSPLGRRAAVVGALCAVALLTLAGVASAHVTVNPRTAEQGSFTKVAFRVPNERDTASTTQLEINFPVDHPIAFVSTRVVPGWTSTVQKTALATPITTEEGGQITQTVSKVTWTGGRIAPGTFEEFDVSLGPLPTDTDQLVFKALQTYDNGEVVRWIDTAPPGAAEPEYPAPVLKLTPANASLTTAITSGEQAPSDPTGVVLGIVGIVLGLVGIGLALLSRRKRPSTVAE